MFLQLVINSLAIGSLYALTAMGATLIYGILGILDIANAGAYLIGAYIGYYIYISTGQLVLAFLGAMLSVGLVGVVLHRTVYGPILAKPRMLSIIPLVAAVGLFTMSSDLIRLLCGAGTKAYNFRFPVDVVRVGSVTIQTTWLLIFALTAVLLRLLFKLLLVYDIVAVVAVVDRRDVLIALVVFVQLNVARTSIHVAHLAFGAGLHGFRGVLCFFRGCRCSIRLFVRRSRFLGGGSFFFFRRGSALHGKIAVQIFHRVFSGQHIEQHIQFFFFKRRLGFLFAGEIFAQQIRQLFAGDIEILCGFVEFIFFRHPVIPSRCGLVCARQNRHR